MDKQTKTIQKAEPCASPVQQETGDEVATGITNSYPEPSAPPAEEYQQPEAGDQAASSKTSITSAEPPVAAQQGKVDAVVKAEPPVAFVDLSGDSTESYTSDDSEDDDSVPCAICLHGLKNLAKRVLTCGHVFCADCIDELLTDICPRCPKCRTKVLTRHIRPVFF